MPQKFIVRYRKILLAVTIISFFMILVNGWIGVMDSNLETKGVASQKKLSYSNSINIAAKQKSKADVSFIQFLGYISGVSVNIEE